MSRIYEFFSQEELQDLLEKATNNVSQLEQELKRLKSQPLGYYDGTRELQSAHRDATEEVAKAHKRGWERGKRECIEITDRYSVRDDVVLDIKEAIAAMEYKGARK